jgi:molecular chaperone DnaK
MAFVGLDFGTTTSILSYLDGKEPKPFHYGGQANGTPYVPSVVAYLPKTLLIGQHAAEMLPGEASVYRYFKMLLPEEDRGKWDADFGTYGRESREPAQVAADFIGELVCGSSPSRERLSLDRHRDAFLQVLGEEIEGLVVSVPHVWSDVRAHGRQQLQTVVHDLLGLPLIQLISEPVAAAAYFTHLYMTKQKEPYLGNLLICDMGGGTFDVTLCKLGRNGVNVLCNAGNGERGLGIAGAHFDHRVLDLKLGSGVKPEVRSELLADLDGKKKRSRKSASRLESYLVEASPQERVEPIYTLASTTGQTVNVYFEDVCEAFAPVREGITQVLTEIREKAARSSHSIDKVIMVGGFSQFPLVQQAVGQFFGEDVFDSPKLIDLVTLGRDDMAFAISYGACLVAGEMVHVSEIYDHTIGIVAYGRQSREGTEIELIKARRSLDTLEKTTFCLREDGSRQQFKITSGTVEVTIFIRLSGSGEEDDKLVRTLSLTDVPNSHLPGNLWFLGTRVDKSKIPYLVLEDEKYGEVKEYALGDLIPPIIIKD